jgi:hypothetical protein
MNIKENNKNYTEILIKESETLSNCQMVLDDIQYIISLEIITKTKINNEYSFFHRLYYYYWYFLIINIGHLFKKNYDDDFPFFEIKKNKNFYSLFLLMNHLKDNYMSIKKETELNWELTYEKIKSLHERLHEKKVEDICKTLNVIRNKHIAHLDFERMINENNPVIKLEEIDLLLKLGREIIDTVFTPLTGGSLSRFPSSRNSLSKIIEDLINK